MVTKFKFKFSTITWPTNVEWVIYYASMITSYSHPIVVCLAMYVVQIYFSQVQQRNLMLFHSQHNCVPTGGVSYMEYSNTFCLIWIICHLFYCFFLFTTWFVLRVIGHVFRPQFRNRKLRRLRFTLRQQMALSSHIHFTTNRQIIICYQHLLCFFCHKIHFLVS